MSAYSVSRISSSAGLFLLLLVSAISAQNISARIFAPRNVQPGTIIDVKILMQSPRQLGGIDFTIRYNDSLFSFLSVEQDTGIGGWEYFQTSHDADSHTVNIFSIADIVNGANHPDSAEFHPKGSIAKFSFFVAPNWISDSAQEQFTFFWKSCGDNAASNKSGFTLIVMNKLLDPKGTVVWNEVDSVGYPEHLRIPNIGLPDSCLVEGGNLDFSIDFQNGAAANYYICGDPDANDLYTISDVVMLISYIFAGGAEPNPLISGDADCNGIVTVSDAVYLISYIFAGGPAPCATCR